MAEMNGVEFKIKVSADDAAKATQKLTSAMGGLNKTLKSTSTSKATTALSRFSASAKKAARSILSMPFKRAAESAGGFATKLGSVVSSFKRVLFYRMVRTVIREIGDAFKYGVNNLYAWSNALGGEFAASMDSIATSFAYFKNSVGAAVAPLINALAPAIDFVIDKAVALLNVINQLFARLTGASYWTRATKQAQSYGGAVSDAGGAAKEALRYLAPFDELNVLPSDSSGGGGGGGGGSGAGGLFEDMVEFDQGIADFADQIRAAIEAGDWQGLGELLGGKLNELVDKIDWAGIGAKFGGFVNAVISTEYWTLKEINFTNIGSKIAEFFNNAIANIDFDIAGRLPVRKLTAIIDTIGGFLGTLDWASIGTAISDFLNGAISEGKEWFQGINWTDVGTKLFNAIYDFITNIKWGELAKNLWDLLVSAIKAATGISEGIYNAMSEKLSVAFSNLQDKVSEWTSGWSISEWFRSWAVIDENGGWDIDAQFSQAWESIKQAFVNGWADLKESLSEGWETFKNDPTINKIADFFSNPLGIIDDALSNNPITKWIDKVKTAFINGVNSLIEIWNGFVDKVSTLDITFTLFGHEFTIGDINIPKIDPIEIPATANLESATDHVPAEDKRLNTQAKLTEAKDSLTLDQKTLPTTSKFTSAQNKLTTTQSTIATKANFTSYKKGFGSYVDAKANLTTYKKEWGKYIDTKANLTNYYRAWSGGPWIDTKANLTNYYRDWSGAPWIDAKANITSASASASNGIVVAGGLTLYTKALGGAFFGGKWHDIPQYASGTLNAGSMFVAGEAGPELVGHINGRTEVLNASQIASAIAAGVSSAQYTVSGGGMDEDALYRAFVRALNDSESGGDIYLDGERIFQSVARHNKQNTRMTGVNAFA